MRVVYHFDEVSVPKVDHLFPLQAERILVLRALIQQIPRHRGHVRMRSGLPGSAWSRLSKDVRSRGEEHLWQPLDCWSSFSIKRELLAALHASRVSVVLVEGIARDDAAAVHLALLEVDGYLGAMQVRLDHEVQASYYSLPLSLRLHDRRVGILVSQDQDPTIAGEDNRDHGWLKFLRRLMSPLGITVDFEYTGLQQTIFDPADDPKVDADMGRAERLLESYMSGMVDDVVIRARDRDPRFITVLAAALKAFDEHEDAEQLAHVALSCRRALIRLADMLYPAEPTKAGERSLGSEAYRNRLWAYADDRLKSDSGERGLYLL